MGCPCSVALEEPSTTFKTRDISNIVVTEQLLNFSSTKFFGIREHQIFKLFMHTAQYTTLFQYFTSSLSHHFVKVTPVFLRLRNRHLFIFL